MLLLTTVNNFWKKLKVNVKKCIFCLAVYTCFSFALYSVIQFKNQHFSCAVFNSSVLIQHKAFRDKIEERLLNISLSEHIPKSNSFGKWMQLVDHVYVYSAFVDKRSSNPDHFIKFVGATLIDKPFSKSFSVRIKCAFKYAEDRIVLRGFASLEIVPESHLKKYAASLFLCSLPKNEQNSLPNYVSLYEDINREIIWVPLHSLSRRVDPDTVSINACVRPIYGSPSAVFFAEFLAYYMLMGVEHYYLYFYNALPKSPLIHLLKNANVSMEILYWDIPLNNENIHEYGQIVFTQDCIARSRFAHTHTIIVDVDEFLVPKQHNSLKTTVAELDKEYKNAGSYVVQNVFFCKEYPIEGYSPLHIVMYRYRQLTAWPHMYRSKYILKPDRVLQGGIHQVWKHELGYKEIWLPATSLLLHHYRPCCGVEQTWFFHLLSFPVLRDNIVLDNSVFGMKKQIFNHTIIKLVLNNTT